MRAFFTYLFCALYLFVSTAVAATSYPPGACSQVPGSKTCVDTTPCKTLSNGRTVACLAGAAAPLGALSLSQTCWKYTHSYACDNGTPVDSCASLQADRSCTLVKSLCVDNKRENGVCQSTNNTYRCTTRDAVTATEMSCSADIFDASTMTAPNNPNDSFVKAALAMEIARQSQVYSQGGTTPVFVGVAESCSKGYWGLKNCCSATPGGKSNRGMTSTMVGGAVAGAVKYVGARAVVEASPYVYDFLYNSGVFSVGMATSIANMGVDAASNAAAASVTSGYTFSAYGFTYGTGTFTATLPGTMNLGSMLGMSPSSGFVAFNPYVLAFTLAMQFIMRLRQCDENELLLQMHKGQNLSVHVRTSCASRILGSCVRHQEHYCSFNSLLAKIINVQGKAQLGRSFSDCSGLTIDEVSRLDFSRIDMSEFTQLMVEEANNGMPSNIKGNYQPVIQSTTKGSTQTPAAGLAYPPPPSP